MEQNLPIIAKKIWKMAKVIYFMLRKGISKPKLFSALNILLKRGKIAGKEAIHNLIFHHHAATASASGRRDYEFSCGDRPAHIFQLHKRKSSGAAGVLTQEDLMAAAAVAEMIGSAAASPALPGFGPSPMVRQLRITDSPFPLRDSEDSQHVDNAAEEFIIKFYKDLKHQNSKFSYS